MDQFLFRVPFAAAGDTAAIPELVQPDGSVSFTQGWGPDYQADLDTDPNAKPIDRSQTNQLFKTITENLAVWQTAQFPEWITSADNGGSPYPYERNAVVRYRPSPSDPWTLYVSLQDANTFVPTDATRWQPVTLQLATQAQAVARALNTVLMTPLRVRESVEAPGWATPAQFSNTTLLATTAFVQRAAGNRADVRIESAGSSSATAADVGRHVVFTGADGVNQAFTLPNAATGGYLAGASIRVTRRTTRGTLTVFAAGGLTIDPGVGSPATSVSLLGGDTADFVWDGTLWRMAGPAVQRIVGMTFGAGIAGWRRDPNGFIEQWLRINCSGDNTASATLPTPFLEEVYNVQTTIFRAQGDGQNNIYASHVVGWTLTTVTVGVTDANFNVGTVPVHTRLIGR